MSSTEDVDSAQSEELPFWRKKDLSQTPTVYDKYTFQKYSEYSRMLLVNDGTKKPKEFWGNQSAISCRVGGLSEPDYDQNYQKAFTGKNKLMKSEGTDEET